MIFDGNIRQLPLNILVFYHVYTTSALQFGLLSTYLNVVTVVLYGDFGDGDIITVYSYYRIRVIKIMML